MKKILLANIGNRNITFNGNLYAQNLGEEKNITFKDWSKDILDNYENLKNKIDINIINPLVVGDDKAFQVYFYYSDQSQLDTYTGKDTLYEAEIMKKILIDKYDYKNEDIHLEKIDCKIINNEDLMKYYRKSLLQLKRKWKNHKFIICDAGGTGQQKMALKIMAEFMLDKERYEIKYVEKNKLTTDVNVDEYRKIISQEQAIKLVHLGQYTAANKLLGYGTIELFHMSKDRYKKVYAHLYFRFIGNSTLAKANLNGLKVRDTHLKNYQQNQLDFDAKGIDKLLDKTKIYKITDYMHKAEFLFNIGQISNSVMAFSQFYEYLFEQYLIKSYEKKKLKKASNTDEAKKDFEVWVMDIIPVAINTCRKRYETKEKKFKIIPSSLAIRCMIARKSSNEIISKVASVLSPHIDYTDDADKTSGYINRLRNKVAHDGLYLTTSDLETGNKAFFYAKLLNEILTIFGFKHENPFNHLNTLVENNLRNG